MLQACSPISCIFHHRNVKTVLVSFYTFPLQRKELKINNKIHILMPTIQNYGKSDNLKEVM